MRGAHLDVFRGNQVCGIAGEAERGRDVKSGGYVWSAIEGVVGVDGEGGRVVGCLDRRRGRGGEEGCYAVGRGWG